MGKKRNPVKTFVLVIGFIIVVAVAAGFLLTHIEFSHTELRDAATSRLSKALGIPVRIEKLSIKLSQGIKVKNLSLGPEGAEILSADGITLQCNFLEMLRKQFNVRSVIVEKPELTLRKEQIAFLLLPLIVASQHSSSGDSNFQFQLAKAEVRDGKVSVERQRNNSFTVDEIDLEISSEGKGKPVKIKAGGRIPEALDFSILGSYTAGKKSPINFKVAADIDWSRIDEMLNKLNLQKIPNLKGTGKSTINITLTGSPNELNIDAASDLTENEFFYGNVLHKPGGFPVKLKMSSVYSSGKLNFPSISLVLGESRMSLSGSFEPTESILHLTVRSDSVIISELAQCMPALKNARIGGEGKLNFEINKIQTAISAKGRIEVKDWKYNNYAGNHLSCNVRSVDKQTKVDDIVAIIGEGRLTGSGIIEPGGKYKFSIKGENIDLEKFLSIKKKDEVALDISGKAKFGVQIVNSGGGPHGLGGSGNIQIGRGIIKSFSWLESLFSTIHLPELMPFSFDRITGSFNIVNGRVDIYNTTIHGEHAVLNTEEGRIDLVKRTKNISTDLALAPHLVERQRLKFKEFDKFFHVDENGFAHLSIVWTGPLSESTPNLTASILKTTIERYGKELLDKLFGKEEDD